MTAVLWELAQRFDVVLLDTPALLPVADAAVLAPVVNGVVLVVSRAQARKEDVQAACQQLADVKARVVGLVMNRSQQNGSHRYYIKR
jgi:Mrp family chromosome partitioning ATPase